MGRAFSDDLRTRIAAADKWGDASCRFLANRFGVSWEYVRKLRQQRREHGSPVRRPQSRYGVASRLSKSVKARSKGTLDQAITEALTHISTDDAKAWFRLHLNRAQL